MSYSGTYLPITRGRVRTAMQTARALPGSMVAIADGFTVSYSGGSVVPSEKPARVNWSARAKAAEAELTIARRLVLDLVRSYDSTDEEAFHAALSDARIMVASEIMGR